MKRRYIQMVRYAFRSLRHPRLRHRKWWRAISRPLFHRSLWIPCRDSVASGLAIGLFFMGVPMVPQSICAAVLAMWMKGNVPIAMGATFISNPFTCVFMWGAQVRLGQWLIEWFNLPVPAFLQKVSTTLPGVGVISVSNFIVGFLAMGFLLALCAYPLVHLLSIWMPHHLPTRSRAMAVVKKRRNIPLRES